MSRSRAALPKKNKREKEGKIYDEFRKAEDNGLEQNGGSYK